MYWTTLIPLAYFLSLSAAVPLDGSSSLHVPLSRRAPKTKTPEQLAAYRQHVSKKFRPNASSHSKRASTGTVSITNENADSSYFGTIQVGTPSKDYNVILDTGSSDLWLATTGCQGCDSGIPLFNPSSSSTLGTSTDQLTINYGSGSVAGTLAQDTVSIAGFTISKQIFATATEVSQGLIEDDITGLLGLAFQTIASTQALPLVQTLAQQNTFTDPIMSFYLTRFLDDPQAQTEEPGGTLTLGGTNSSLMQGNVDFVDIPSSVTPSFWLIPLTQVTVQGTNVAISQSGTDSLAAIDTGTTLIGGPTDVVTQIYSNIKGSQQGTGQLEGYWTIPCNTDVNVAMTFSSQSWPISPADFSVQQLQGNQCLGAIFELDAGGQSSGGGPDWVIGDTFLKNVYSVFRYTPPSVGFAQLASSVQGSSSTSGTSTDPKSTSTPAPISSHSTRPPLSSSSSNETSFVSSSFSGSTPTASGTPQGSKTRGNPLPTGTPSGSASNPFSTPSGSPTSSGASPSAVASVLLVATVLMVRTLGLMW
ncbi:acid protease [Sistotremastrum niveocremeum HHB9708]|uniref:Acid protease n=1 Tax=Sistotremastrum niveocremeum HHB9708 TaxID=1314777 RepID=A0A165A0N4_9AGAM|nr:acid protease [Sistotremastrum niveocremeum HHB9708]